MIRYFLIALLAFGMGAALGAYLFSDTRPRSVLRMAECETNCFSQEEILGLLGSIGMQRFSGLLPSVVKETDKTLVIKHPFPKSDVHYVIIPKADIKAAEDISEDDAPYLVDAYALIGALVREENLRNYKIVVNGPGFQTVGYLHFHLVAELPE